MKFILAIALAAVVLFLPAMVLFLPAMAFAQTVTDPTPVMVAPGIDVTELLKMVILAVGSVLGTVIIWAVQRFTGIRIQGQAAAVLQNSLEWAANKAVGEVDKRGQGYLSTNNKLVDAAAQYVVDTVPGALEKVGVDMKTAEGRKRLDDMVKARLSELDPKTPAVNPGAPPAPAPTVVEVVAPKP